MNRDDIIRMAREAGARPINDYYTRGVERSFNDEALFAFATLVVAFNQSEQIHSCHAECQNPICVAVRAERERKPLTKEQLLYVYNQLPNWGMDMDNISQNLVAFARAIERAHGIGGKE